MVNACLWLPGEPRRFENVDNWVELLTRLVEQAVATSMESCTVFQQATLQVSRLLHAARKMSVDSLRIGSETCVHKTIDPSVLRAFARITSRSGLGLQVVLPPLAVNDACRIDLTAILEELPPSCTLVVNDLGTLSRLCKSVSNSVIAGRLLWKQKRAVRFFPDEFELLSQDELNEWFGFHFPVWLQQFNVRLLEIDMLPPGVRLGGSQNCSVHVPWALVSYGRICYIGSLGLGPHEKFQVSSPCRRECRSVQHVLCDESCPTPVLRCGKGVYCLSRPVDYSWLQHKALASVVVDLRPEPG